MKKINFFIVAFIIAATTVPRQAYCGSNPGPVKIAVMTRVESHSKVSDSSGNFSPETFGYFSISAFRELQKGTFGDIFYLNKYSIDDGNVASNIGGISLIHSFGRYLTGVIGYTYSSDPLRGAVVLIQNNGTETRDRFSTALNWKVNPNAKRGPQFSLYTSYSTITDFNEEQSIAEKIEMRMPHIGGKLEGAVGYTYSYSLQEDEQLTNQYNAGLTYKCTKAMNINLAGLYIDNVYTGNQGDDSVGRITLNYNLR